MCQHYGRHFEGHRFKCIFINENVWIQIEFYWNVILWGSNWQSVNIGLCDGLAPDTRQAITRIKAEQDVWRYIVKLKWAPIEWVEWWSKFETA